LSFLATVALRSQLTETCACETIATIENNNGNKSVTEPEFVSRGFPSLDSSRLWRYFVFTMLYVAQGIPLGLLLMALPAYLAFNGVEAGVIGAYIGLATLPHAIKLIAGPILDRWTFAPMGRRRPWVLIAQSAIVVSFAAMALIPDPLNNIPTLLAASVMVNSFVAFQDVSVDGMAVDILRPEEQSRAGGFMFGGQSLGIAAITAGGAWLMSVGGIGMASLACSGLVALIMMLPLMSRERDGERLLPWTKGQATIVPHGSHPSGWVDILFSLKNFVFMRTSVILVLALLTYTLGRGLHAGIMPVYFVQELGWSDTSYSNLTGLASLIAAIIAMTIGGTLVHWIGRVNFFAVTTIALSLLALAIALLPVMSGSDVLLQIYRIAYTTLDVLVVVSVIAISMAVCGKKVAATQFAIYMALSNLGYVGGSSLLGPAREFFGFDTLFLIFAGLTFASLFIMRLVLINDHQEFLKGMELAMESGA
jgi:PAT family beta-lactamase induction signal transducer AmpG